MKKIQRIALGLALLAALAGGAGGASAKSNRARALSGTVQSIDLRARTVEVRERETGRVVNVRVPEGALVRTNITNQPLVQIERLLPGMTVSVVVQ
ncbi:MAG TPA: hypothetical protein VF297_06460 [Pyrinomonadaceae bacterium]